MKKNCQRYSLYRAYHYYILGEPLPCDEYHRLLEEGYDPDELMIAFSEGYTPEELDDLLEGRWELDWYEKI